MGAYNISPLPTSFSAPWVSNIILDSIAEATEKAILDGIFAFSTTPLRVSTIIGLLTALLSIIYLVIVVIQKLAFGIDVEGYATIVVLILLLGGIQLCCIGIIGEYIARTYIQTKNRPIYIAKDVIKNHKYHK